MAGKKTPSKGPIVMVRTLLIKGPAVAIKAVLTRGPTVTAGM
jgi:hypothetical protein